MATATLELINPYAKYGLKRRPTYQEIIGLIDENETLTGKLPDRTATFYKASPEGSFFDGTDHLEVLKEQQQRIHERQMRELLLRQNMGGRTYHAERLRQQRNENAPPQPETPNDDNMADAQMQTELQRRATEYANRQQQTGEAHQGFLSRTSTPPIIRELFDFSPLSRTSSRGGVTPQLRMPQPRDGRITPEGVNNPELFVIGGETDSEGEMMTARANNEDLIKNSLKFRHPNATEREVERTVEVLLPHKNLTPEQIATNFTSFAILNNIFSVLNRNGFISDDVMEEYQELTGKISSEGNGRKRARLLRQLADHYRNNVYDLYIDDMSNRPVGV